MHVLKCFHALETLSLALLQITCGAEGRNEGLQTRRVAFADEVSIIFRLVLVQDLIGFL